jgi:hypothetical protein
MSDAGTKADAGADDQPGVAHGHSSSGLLGSLLSPLSR